MNSPTTSSEPDMRLQYAANVGFARYRDGEPRPSPDDFPGDPAAYQAAEEGWYRAQESRLDAFAERGRKHELARWFQAIDQRRPAVGAAAVVTVKAPPSLRPQKGEVPPPATRFNHGELKMTQAAVHGPSGRVVGVVRQWEDVQPTALQRLAARYPEDLTKRLVRAGMQLREEWDQAGIEPRQVSAYSPLGAAGESEDDETPICRSRAAQRAMDHVTTLAARSVLKYVVIHDIEDSRVGLLKIALVQLARFYRIED